ncbi:MAG: sulfurtransferase [Desulfuromonadales bacterium]|nr:sulfurtransferase [Desulfuromonadales bacterium]
MRIFHSCVVSLFLMVLLLPLLGGCGNSGGETTPAPALTGDATVFPNAVLLATPSPGYEIPSQTTVLDARRTQDEYDAGHIPGAIFAPPSLFETNGKLKPDSDLANELGKLGITRDSKILIYDNTTASLGSGGRLFWILEYMGCTNVTVLNGGWDLWKAQDMPVESAAIVHPSIVQTTFTAMINPEMVESVTKEYVKEHFITTPAAGFILIDVRAAKEYVGDDLNGAARPGHIPGAINLPYTECFNAKDKSILSYEGLKNLLAARGITLDNNPKIVAYSTIGHRSGFFYFLCRLMGYENVANYTGSIVDWAKADPNEYPMIDP